MRWSGQPAVPRDSFPATSAHKICTGTYVLPTFPPTGLRAVKSQCNHHLCDTARGLLGASFLLGVTSGLGYIVLVCVCFPSSLFIVLHTITTTVTTTANETIRMRTCVIWKCILWWRVIRASEESTALMFRVVMKMETEGFYQTSIIIHQMTLSHHRRLLS
jgi:hypothetical protein